MSRLITKHASAVWLALAATLVAGWFSYAPGLSGGFLFDDFANLPALGAYGPVDNWTTFWRYVTSGTADPTGRPLSLLSFLVDARNWPADPYPFKRTGILLHLCNGFLLFVLLRQLGTLLARTPREAAFAAVLGMALWLLHPFLVSTTLYIVQREAMLPCTFMLLGLIGYVAGRNLVLEGRMSGALLAALSVLTGTTLAFLSKANGALLPLLVWIVEAVLLAPRRPLAAGRAASVFNAVRWLVVVTPSLLLLAYLARVGVNGFVHGTPIHRPWTLGERLLTESRVLVDYLANLWLPKPFTKGLFNDAIVVSTGLLTPWTTLASILLISTLLALAIAIRRQAPAWSLAILFFFAAHLMESSVITLELYYEHRNYVPALLMFWPLSLWLSGRTTVTSSNGFKPGTANGVKTALALALTLVLAVLTWMRADLWGNAHDQASLWALRNPESPRAQAYAAQMDLARGEPLQAVQRLEPMIERRPDDIQAALNLVGAKCSLGQLTPSDIERAATALRTTQQFERMGYRWFERSIATAHRPPCPQMDVTSIHLLLDAAKANPHARQVRGRRQDLLNLEARIALVEDDPKYALELLNAALDEDPRPGAALMQAAFLGQSGHADLGLKHLDHFERSDWHPPENPWRGMRVTHQWLLGKQSYWANEIRRLRAILEEDVAANPITNKPRQPPP